MLTPYLEKLIQDGQAYFRTFNAGGSQKSVLKVPNDRYIVIIGFTYFPFIPLKGLDPATVYNTMRVIQMAIGSPKSFNHFLIRNNTSTNLIFDGGLLVNSPVVGEPHNQNLYLIHDEDVSITFSKGEDIKPIDVGVSPPESPAKPPPLQYGREGQKGITATGNLPVYRKVAPASFINVEYRPLSKFTKPSGGIITTSFEEVQFPVEPPLDLKDGDINDSNAYPLVSFKYVEIMGNPNNKPSNN